MCSSVHGNSFYHSLKDHIYSCITDMCDQMVGKLRSVTIKQMRTILDKQEAQLCPANTEL